MHISIEQNSTLLIYPIRRSLISTASSIASLRMRQHL
jgi:hypothetical protein